MKLKRVSNLVQVTNGQQMMAQQAMLQQGLAMQQVSSSRDFP